MPIVPTRLAFADDGTPWSDIFGDVYHSAMGGVGQAHHVFLAGNGLPGRWRGRRRFVVLETGFGLGLNFLATWAAWRRDPQRCDRLHFVSCELHPFSSADLERLHDRWPEFESLARELRASWPELTPGVHRLHLDDERVTLTLYLGDARDGLAQLDVRADALFLDGFSPARNPELWSPRIFHLLARLAAPDATLATWSVAGEVREGLRRAGFQVDKAPGFNGKRQMLHGRRAATEMTNPAEPDRAMAAERRALIIGAGIAGTSVAERLSARGWRVHLIDAADSAGEGASGNHAGVLRPLPSLDDNRMSRLTRAGTLYGWRHIARLAAKGHPVRADASGVLHLARDEAQQDKMRAVVERLAAPPTHLRFVTAAEATTLAGWPLALGGWWFAGSGWVQPPSLCRANLDAGGEAIQRHFGCRVAHLERRGDNWHALGADGNTIASAPVAVLAAGTAIRAFAQAEGLPVVSARGQVSLLVADDGSAPRVVVCRGGYVSPAIDGLRCAGATFSVDDDELSLRIEDHAENLAKLDAMLPGYASGLDAAGLGGRVGFRPASPDRLPMVGAVPLAVAVERNTPLHAIARIPGLHAISGFGARGLVWSALMAELLASQLEGDPLPLARDLCEAVDPARFILRPPTTARIAE
jgi:tRNA 5-methylaminomethyl-2-thiouridine biosynthesis bifunctional protein